MSILSQNAQIASVSGKYSWCGYGDYFSCEEEYQEWVGSTISPPKDWHFFRPYHDIETVVDGLADIPSTWALVLIADKAPKRKDWQIEPPLSRAEIIQLLRNGDRLISQNTNKPYTAYYSGIGVRTGEVSDGLLTIDVDGISAKPLLDLMSGGDLPETVSWKSGKPGRQQLAYQIPAYLRELLKDFTKVALKTWGPLQTNPKEQLEFRYNFMQSCLPPSRHPETGQYQWVNSPEHCKVAIAPEWLCQLLVKFITEGTHLKQEAKQTTIDAEKLRKERQRNNSRGATKDLVDFLKYDVLPKLDVFQIYNGDHKFQQFGSTLKGDPTWRESSSKTSLHVWWDGEQYAFQDKALGFGGGAVQYRWRMKGGEGTPRGKDFVQIVRELAAEAGVPMPEFRRLPQGDENGDRPTAQTYEQWREDFNNKCIQVARHNLTYKPNISLTGDQKLTDIDFELLPKKGVIAVRAGWGLLKTTACAKWLKQFDYPERLAIVHRVSLVDDIAPKLNLISYEILKSCGKLNDFGTLAIVDVSMAIMLDVASWGKKKYILVIDETEQVLSSLTSGGTLKGKLRLAAKTKYEYLIRNAELVICLDADLSDLILNWIKYLRQEEDIFLIQHQAKVGERRSKLNITTNRGVFLDRLYADVEAGEKPQIFCEHRSDAQEIAAHLESLNLKVGSYHGRNSNEPDVAPVLATISQYDTYSQYDAEIYTSVLGTGVSQEKFHFTKRYVLFHGDALTATEGLQGPWRYRPDVPTEIYLSDQRRTFNIDSELELLNLYSKETATNELFQMQEEVGIHPTLVGVEKYTDDDKQYLDLWAQIKCRRNASLANPMGVFLDVLDQNGLDYSVEEIDDEEGKGFLDSHKEGIKDRNNQRDETVAASPLIDEDTYKSFLKKGGKLVEAQQVKLEKYRIHSWTGMDVTPELVKIERQNGIIKKVQLLNCILGTEKAAIALDDKDRQSNPIITDRTYWTLKRNLIHKLGLVPLLEPGWKYNSDSPQIVEIAETARRTASEIKKILNLSISNQKIKDKKTGEVKFKVGNMAVVGMLLKLLGITTDSEGYPRRYFIEKDNWDLVQKILEHQRNKKLTDGDDSTLHTPPYVYSNNKGGVQGSNAVPDLRTGDDVRSVKKQNTKPDLDNSLSFSLEELGNFDDEEYPFSLFDSKPPVSFAVGSVVECAVDGVNEVGLVGDAHFCPDTNEWVYRVEFLEGEALICQSGMRLWSEDLTEAIA